MPKITLSAARINAGLTQQDVSEKLKITPKTLSRWENYQAYPNVETAFKLCKLYGVTLDDVSFLPSESD